MLGRSHIKFVFDLAHNLFQHVFHRDHTGGGPELIYYDRQVTFAIFELFQQFSQDFGLGDHQHIVHDLTDAHG